MRRIDNHYAPYSYHSVKGSKIAKIISNSLLRVSSSDGQLEYIYMQAEFFMIRASTQRENLESTDNLEFFVA